MPGASDIRAGGAFVELFTKNDSLKRGLALAQGQLKSFGSGILSLGSKLFSALGIGTLIGGGLGALLAPGAFIHGIEGALELGGTLDNLAARTGGAIGPLAILRKAFELAGVGADRVGPAVSRLQKILANPSDKQAAAIESLGLNIDDLLALDPATQFQTVGAAIGALTDPTARAAAAWAIFGRAGTQLLPLFTRTGLMGEAAVLLGGQTEILARRAPLFHELADVFGSWKDKLMGLWVGVADGFAPVLEIAANWFKTLDLSALGQRIGNAFLNGFDILRGAMSTGTLTELLRTGFVYGISAAADFLAATFGAVITGLITVMVQPGFWRGIGEAFFAALLIASERLVTMLFSLFERIQDPFASKGAIKVRASQAAAQFHKELWGTTGEQMAGTAAKGIGEALAGGVQAALKNAAFGPSAATIEAKSNFDKLADGALQAGEKLRESEEDLSKFAFPIQDLQEAAAATVADWREVLIGGSMGTFSSAFADRLGTGGPLSRIAAASDETAKNTAEINDKLDEAEVM